MHDKDYRNGKHHLYRFLIPIRTHTLAAMGVIQCSGNIWSKSYSASLYNTHAMKRFRLCSLWSHLNALTFFPLTGGCSEGLGAFRIFFQHTTVLQYLYCSKLYLVPGYYKILPKSPRNRRFLRRRSLHLWVVAVKSLRWVTLGYVALSCVELRSCVSFLSRFAFVSMRYV